jgi:dolichol kinase
MFPSLVCPREVDSLSLTWFLLGVFLVLWLPEPTVAPAILVLAVADPAASLVGRKWGRRNLGKGTVEGALAFFGAAAVVLIPFVGVAVAVGVAAAAAAVEVLETGLDDNLLIPVTTAGCLWVALGS